MNTLATTTNLKDIPISYFLILFEVVPNYVEIRKTKNDLDIWQELVQWNLHNQS